MYYMYQAGGGVSTLYFISKNSYQIFFNLNHDHLRENTGKSTCSFFIITYSYFTRSMNM